jgi:hypothetical protein
VMGQRKLNLANGHGCLQNKQLSMWVDLTVLYSWNWYFGLVGLFTWSFFHSVQAVDFKNKEVMAAFAPYLQES